MRVTTKQLDLIKTLALMCFEREKAILYLKRVKLFVITSGEAKATIDSLQQLSKFKRYNK
jgi:hypothetical protein